MSTTDEQRLRERIQAEIDHAIINDMRLEPAFGKLRGVPAVRVSNLEAALSAQAEEAPAEPVAWRELEAASQAVVDAAIRMHNAVLAAPPETRGEEKR